MGYACKLSDRSNLQRVVIGTSNSADPRTFNVASILPNKYKKLTIDNFAVLVNNVTNSSNSSYSMNALFNRYNSTNGIFYTNRASNFTGSYSASNQCVTFTLLCFFIGYK